MNRFTTLILAGAITITSAAAAARAAELTVEQRTARTIFQNDLFDAQEKLHDFKTGRLKMDWKYYDETDIQPLKKSLEACRKANVPGDAEIELGSKKVPFSEAAEQAAKIEGEFKAAFGMKDDKVATFKNGQTPENLKRYEAFKVQMTKGLSGDKLRIMNEEILIQGVVYAQDPPKFYIGYYGEGRKLLTKPEEFANAKVWATTAVVYASNDPLKRDPHWRVSAYYFDGMKLVRQTEERGAGTAVPDSYFQAGGK